MLLRLALVGATVAAATALAADCTKKQLDAAAERPEVTKAQSACAELKAEFTTASDAEIKALCKRKECFSALAAAIEWYPDCEYRGANLKSAFEMTYKTILDGCSKAGYAIDASSGSSSTSSSLLTLAVIFVAFVVQTIS